VPRGHGITHAVTKPQRQQDPQARRDDELLRAVLEHPGLDELHFDGGSPREVFEGWAERLKSNGCTKPLSAKQRQWLEGVAKRLDVDVGSANLVSSGAVAIKPKERESLRQFLDSLGPLPKKPPHLRGRA
jgi:hypothetical protein